PEHVLDRVEDARMMDQVAEEGEVEMRLVPHVARDRPAARPLVRLELAAQGPRLGRAEDLDREVVAVPAIAGDGLFGQELGHGESSVWRVMGSSRIPGQNHGADAVPATHRLEALVDAGKRQAVGDQLVELELAVEIGPGQPGKVAARAGAAVARAGDLLLTHQGAPAKR